MHLKCLVSKVSTLMPLFAMPVLSISSSFSIHKPIPLRLLSIRPGADEETVRFILKQNKQIRDHNQKALDAWKAAKRKQDEEQAEKVASGPQTRSRRHRMRKARACTEQAHYNPSMHKLYATSRVEMPPAKEPRQKGILNPNLLPCDRAIICDECHKEGRFLAESCRPRPSCIKGYSCMNCFLRHKVCRWYGEKEYHNGLVAFHEGHERPSPYHSDKEYIPRTRKENGLTRTNYT